MDFGYVENPNTNQKANIEVNYHQPVRVIALCGLLGFLIAAVCQWEYKRGAVAFDNAMTKSLVDAGLMDVEKK